MPLQHAGHAPYAPPSTVALTIDRARKGNLPTPVDASVLERIGVSGSLVRRTSAGLKLLELVDNDGNPTTTLDELRMAKTDEFQPAVAKWLRSVYGDVFGIVPDLARATYDNVEDAFRGYAPAGQRTRMVTLFIGLCDFAGLLPEDSALRAATRNVRREPIKRASPEARRAASNSIAGAKAKAEQRRRKTAERDQVPQDPPPGRGELDPIIAGLVRRLPPVDAEWSATKRKAWLKAAEAAFDVLYELPSEDGKEVMP